MENSTMQKSADSNQMPPDNPSVGWADRPQAQQFIRYVLYAIAAILFLADFVVHRHTVLDIEALPVFYAGYGFIALIATVQLAKGLRRLVGRDENYYEKPAKPVKTAVDDDE
jgi:hypothetical protein